MVSIRGSKILRQVMSQGACAVPPIRAMRAAGSSVEEERQTRGLTVVFSRGTKCSLHFLSMLVKPGRSLQSYLYSIGQIPSTYVADGFILICAFYCLYIYSYWFLGETVYVLFMNKVTHDLGFYILTHITYIYIYFLNISLGLSLHITMVLYIFNFPDGLMVVWKRQHGHKA